MQKFKTSVIDFFKGFAMIIGFYVMAVLFFAWLIIGLFGINDLGKTALGLITLITIIFSLYRLYVSIKRRCLKCGKLDAAREIDRDEINRERIIIYKKVYDKETDGTGKTIRTIARNVPVNAYSITYDVLKECKYCDERFIVQEKIVEEI